ncbi:MAG: hypothetical protein MOP51_2771 [Citricoccus sp.]|nr:hypothetical protein [Citricoccus sp. WCRC_4]
MSTSDRPTRTLTALGLTLALTAWVGAPALAATPAPDTEKGSAPATQVTPYQPSGTQVTGGESLADAVEVEPGLYQDTLQTSEEASSPAVSTRFYRLPALQDGERAHAAAVLAADPHADPRGTDWAELTVEFVNLQGEQCGPPVADNVSMTTGAVPVAKTATDPMEAGSHGCFEDGSGVVVAQVSRSGEWLADDPVAVELRFWVEPPVDESGLAEAPSEDLPPESVTVTGEARPVTGGRSFGTATEITAGQVYSAELQPREASYFRVPVEYGQRLSYRLSSGNNQQARVREIRTSAHDPLLGDPRMLGDQGISYTDNGATLTRSTAVPVSADNYGSYSYGALRFAGDYYIVVTGSEARGGREGTEPFRYELAVSLSGEAAGATEWLAAAQDEQTLAAGGSADGEDAQAAGARNGGWLPSSTELGALLGGVGLGAVLTGIAWLLLRRRRSA